MKDKLILEIIIEVYSEQITSLTGAAGTVQMIPFGGTVDCELFKGVVAPGGVDTQVVNQNGVRNMSARYMLTGTDKEGQSCHIYIDNEGWFSEKDSDECFKTIPHFLTDSVCLGPYLHQNKFRGEGFPGEKGPVIRIYEIIKD